MDADMTKDENEAEFVKALFNSDIVKSYCRLGHVYNSPSNSVRMDK